MDELVSQRKEIEGKLDDLYDVLKSHNCDMQTSLLTEDGYPRADIDIPQVRTTRAEIIRLQNDLKGVMAQVEEELVKHFQSQSGGGDAVNSSNNSSGSGKAVVSPAKPFAIVKSVADGGAANEAGLHPNDLIVKFGEANSTNHDGLKKLAQVVQGSDEVVVTVQRGDELVNLSFKGKQSLGCHIVPL